jgi:hypothetical protein
MIRLSNLMHPITLFCLLVGLTGCAPSYVSTEDLGTKATAQEIRDHYSGNSIRYAQQSGGPINTEAYFAPDGTYKLVALDGTPIFSTGTWRANDASSPTLLIEAQDFFVDDGGTRSRRSPRTSFWIYIQPDGSVKADLVGGGNFDQPRTTPGFQAEGRYNELRREAGF